MRECRGEMDEKDEEVRSKNEKRKKGKKKKWKGARRKTRIDHLILLSFGNRTVNETLFPRVNSKR